MGNLQTCIRNDHNFNQYTFVLSNIFILLIVSIVSVVVPFVECFGFELMCCLRFMCVFIFLLKFEYLSGRLLGKKLLTRLNCRFSFFPTSVFGVGISFWFGLVLIIAYSYLIFQSK